MRPHVEMIHEDDYVWHGAELPGSEGRASERRLSVDEEDGSSLPARRLPHRLGPRSRASTMPTPSTSSCEGPMTYGDKTIGKGGYVYAPKGVPTEAMTFAEGTRLLHYREYGDAGFDAVDSMRAARWAEAREEVIVLDTEAMKFDAVPNPGPMPGMFIKYLHVRPGDRLLHPPGPRPGGLGGPPPRPPPVLRGGVLPAGSHGVQLRHPRRRHLLLPSGARQARPLHDDGGWRHDDPALGRRAAELVHPERMGALGRRGRELGTGRRPSELSRSPPTTWPGRARGAPSATTGT